MSADPQTTINPWPTGTAEWQKYDDQRALRERSQTTAPNSPEWVQGFAAAAAEVARTFGEQTIARELMLGVGLTLPDLINAEVEAYDFDPIRRAMQ